MSDTAVRYAGALYQVTMDETELSTVHAALTGEPLLWEALISPAVKPGEKNAVLSRLPVFQDKRVLLRFCKLLCDKGRMGLLPQIVKEFHTLGLETRGAAECVMTCVHRPGEEQQAQIKDLLCKLHGKREIYLEICLDPTLLGGFTLELLGVKYDKSVRGQLNALARQLV